MSSKIRRPAQVAYSPGPRPARRQRHPALGAVVLAEPQVVSALEAAPGFVPPSGSRVPAILAEALPRDERQPERYEPTADGGLARPERPRVAENAAGKTNDECDGSRNECGGGQNGEESVEHQWHPRARRSVQTCRAGFAPPASVASATGLVLPTTPRRARSAAKTRIGWRRNGTENPGLRSAPDPA